MPDAQSGHPRAATRMASGDVTAQLGGDEFAWVIAGPAALAVDRLVERVAARLSAVGVSASACAATDPEAVSPVVAWKLTDDRTTAAKQTTRTRPPERSSS